MAKLEVTFRGLCAFVTDTRDNAPARVTVVLIDGRGAGHHPHRATLTFNARDFDKDASDIGDLEVEQAPGGMLVAVWPIEKRELSIASGGGQTLSLEQFELIDVETVRDGVAHESCKPRQNPRRPIAARFVIDRGVVFCKPGDERDPTQPGKVEVVRYRIETAGDDVAIAATNLTGSSRRTLHLKPKTAGDTVGLAVSDLPSLLHLGEPHNVAYQRLLRDEGEVQISGGACIPRRMFERDP